MSTYFASAFHCCGGQGKLSWGTPAMQDKAQKGKKYRPGCPLLGRSSFRFFFSQAHALMCESAGSLRDPRPVSSLAASHPTALVLSLIKHFTVSDKSSPGHRSSRRRDDRAQHRSFNQRSRDNALDAGPILTRGNCSCPSHSPFDFNLGVRRIAHLSPSFKCTNDRVGTRPSPAPRRSFPIKSGLLLLVNASTPRFVFFFPAARQPVTVRGV